MKTHRRLPLTVLTCALASVLVLAVMASPADAASPSISDTPLAAAKRPNPNMIMAIDDSGSMDSEIGMNASDGALWWRYDKGRFFGFDKSDTDKCTASTTNAWGCTTSQSTNVNPSALAANTDSSGNVIVPMVYGKFAYLFPNGICDQETIGRNGFGAFPSAQQTPSYPCDTRSYGDDFKGMSWYSGASNNVYRHYTVAPTSQFGWMRSSVYNGLYYNPAITYLPWKAYYTSGGTCPAGSWNSTTKVCTPNNASITSTLSHPYYGSSSSPSNLNLFSTVNAPTDGSGNPLTIAYTGGSTSGGSVSTYMFRMYPGMIVPKGAKYLVYKTFAFNGASVWNQASGNWTSASKNLCITNSTISSCDSHMGMPIANKNSDKIDISSSNKDHVDVAYGYVPGVYWQLANGSALCGTAAAPNQTNVALELCAWGPDGQLLQKIDLTSPTANPFTAFTAPSTRTDCSGSGGTCTLSDEKQNFANWFQYYRKRHLMLNAALGNAFDGLHGLRAGYFNFNDMNNVTMYDFDSTTGTAPATVADPTKNWAALIGQLYQTTGDGATPTRQSLDYINKQFRRGSSDSGRPITDYCQFNAGFIITDGFASTTTASDLTAAGVTYGNYDGQTPTSTNYKYNKQYNTDPTVVNTAPYADTTSNTLADIAMKIYTENPRTDLTLGGVPVDKSDVTPNADRNPDLHINTYGMIIGLNGSIFGDRSTAALRGQNDDPFTNNPDWNSLGNTPQKSQSPMAIDELWHATLNGRGQMLQANSPEQTRDAVLTIVANIVSKGGSAAAVAVSNPNPVPGDNYAYASSYNSGSWSGDLNAFALNLTTGKPDETTPVWNPSPQHQLASRDYTTRIIATYSGTAGIAFQWSALTSGQQTALGDTNVLSFLRGDRSKEGTLYRGRGPRAPYPNNVVPDNVAVLGDIVNAEPVYVSAPRFGYVDKGYSTFKSGTAATRTKMVYQGANDGMLHAFNATTGAEAWAYVPSPMFTNLANLSSKNAFNHRFYVDGTPVSGDVDFTNTNGVDQSTTPPPAADWHTILVGAYGKGGRGYYALDVTDPTVSTDAGLAGKVLWEFPNNSTSASDKLNVGFSFGRAIIVKTRAAGWVVLAPSGYNNGTNTGDSGGDGKGHLFVLNAKTGAKLADLVTGAGTAASPSGLAYISAWVDHANTDNTVESVYGGDLTGSVWRFDLSSTDSTKWAVQLVATLKDSSSNTQPVTTEPELGLVNRNRVVYIGTGQYLGTPDVTSTNSQTMYALRDDYLTTKTTPLTTPIIADPTRSSLVQQVISVNATTGDVSMSTTAAVDLTTKAGWYIDLPSPGTGKAAERIVTSPALGQGVLAFTTNTPDGSDVCLPGGSSKIYMVNYATGGYVPTGTETGGVIGGKLTSNSTLASRVQMIKLPSGSVVGLVRQSDATTTVTNIKSVKPSSSGKRKSWREINVQ